MKKTGNGITMLLNNKHAGFEQYCGIFKSGQMVCHISVKMFTQNKVFYNESWNMITVLDLKYVTNATS